MHNPINSFPIAAEKLLDELLVVVFERQKNSAEHATCRSIFRERTLAVSLAEERVESGVRI